MDLYMLDTNACIGVLTGKSHSVVQRMQQIAPERIVLAAVTVAELHFGVHNSADVARSMRMTTKFLAPFRVVAFDTEGASVYGRIRALLKAQGQMIGANDLLIAATAVASEATLVTHNTREFSRVPELKLVDWETPG